MGLRLGVSHGFGSAAVAALRRRDWQRVSGVSARHTRRGVIVRVIDFHPVGLFGLEQSLRWLEREETRGSLRRVVWSDRKQAADFGLQCRVLGASVLGFDSGITVAGRVPEEQQNLRGVTFRRRTTGFSAASVVGGFERSPLSGGEAGRLARFEVWQLLSWKIRLSVSAGE
jgi:hypothetical protein